MKRNTHALTARSSFLAGLGIVLTMLSAACSKPDDAYVETSRCHYAGTTLNEPFLIAATKSWSDKHLADVELNNRDLAIGAEKLQKEIAPDGTRTSARTILDVADKWKRSDYCQKVLEEFKLEVPKIIAKAATPQTDNKCSSMKWQLDVMEDAVLGSPKSQVMPGVVGTIHNALAVFAPEKKDYLKAEMMKAPEPFIGLVVRSCSSSKQGELSAAINETETASKYVSQRTQALKPLSYARQVRDCGELPEVYCRGDLEVNISFPLAKKSAQCDKEIKLTSECEWSVESVVSTQMKQAEDQLLTKAKADLERYMADPDTADVFFRTKVGTLANRCRAEAMARGMRSNELQEYFTVTCAASARQQLLAVKEQTLRKVIARLEQQQSPTSTAPRATATASSPPS